MKKILLLVALLMTATIGVQAQKDIPANLRVEVAEAEKDDADYSIFIYKDDNGTQGYYMSLGGTSQLFSISIGGFNDLSIEDVFETCLWLGNTTDEVFAALDTILAMYDMEVGTVREFQGRTTTGAGRLAEQNVAKCEVMKRLIGGNRLLFSFVSGKYQCGVYLTKGVVKQLRFGLKTNMKLNPKLHR